MEETNKTLKNQVTQAMIETLVNKPSLKINTEDISEEFLQKNIKFNKTNNNTKEK